MVIIDISELEVLNSVELDCEQVVREVSDVGGVEEAQVLTRKSCWEVYGRRESEGESMAAEFWVFGDDDEGERGRERESRAIGGVLEVKWRGVKSMTHFSTGLVG